MNELFIGIDLGGTNIKFGCFDHGLDLITKASVETAADMGPETVVERMGIAIRDMLADQNLTLNDVLAVGIGTPGPAIYSQGIIVNSTNMPQFKNTPIRQMVSDNLSKPVVFDNDANVACWGEFVCGAGKETKDMVFFTLGTGIGGGIVSNGELLRGCADNAAELGHIIIYPDGRLCNCGQKGCAEAYASASWTAARAKEAIEQGQNSSLKKVLETKGQITCKDVYEHLKSGDALAKEITEQTAKVLAILCINILHTTEPQKILFAGGMIAAGDILLDRIRYHFDQHIWKLKKETVEIDFAALGEDAGIFGAAAMAKHIQKL